MIHTFAKLWLEATCAPKSITNLETNRIKNNYLDLVTNEDCSIKIYVLSNDIEVLAIGKSFNTLLSSSTYSFKDSLKIISKELKLLHINQTH